MPKPRCPFVAPGEDKACRKPVNAIVGSCDKCNQYFCMTHRLYEDHRCLELPTVR